MEEVAEEIPEEVEEVEELPPEPPVLKRSNKVTEKIPAKAVVKISVYMHINILTNARRVLPMNLWKSLRRNELIQQNWQRR